MNSVNVTRLDTMDTMDTMDFIKILLIELKNFYKIIDENNQWEIYKIDNTLFSSVTVNCTKWFNNKIAQY